MEDNDLLSSPIGAPAPALDVRRGSYIEAKDERSDFDIHMIRGTAVPEKMGSDVPLDDNNTLLSSMQTVSGFSISDETPNTSGATVQSQDTQIVDEQRSIGSSSLYPDEGYLETYHDQTRRESGSGRRIRFLFGGFLLIVLIGSLSYRLGGELDSVKSKSIGGISFRGTHPDLQFPDLGDEYDPEEVVATLAANVNQKMDEKIDVPVVWLVPRTTSMAVRDILNICYDYSYGTSFEGVDHKAVATVKIIDSLSTFSQPFEGRLFSMFRDPVPRTVDLYNSYLDNHKDISLEDFLRKMYPSNFLTRTLTNKLSGPVTLAHLEQAKKILKEKMLVGLTSHTRESYDRFANFAGLEAETDEQHACVEKIMKRENNYMMRVELPSQGSNEFAMLQRANNLDIPLYEYATQLFDEQEPLYSPAP